MLGTSRQLARPWKWPAPERGLFVDALRLAIWVEFHLRFSPFTRVLAGLNIEGAARTTPVSAASVQRAIERAYRVLPFEATCLRHSLVFCRIFRRHGQPAELRIGVKKTDQLLASHAWVEDRAGAVLTRPEQDFAPLPLPSEVLRIDGQPGGFLLSNSAR